MNLDTNNEALKTIVEEGPEETAAAGSPAPEELEAQQEPDNALDDKEAELDRREQALAVRERRFQAREHLLAMGLPEGILQHVDCGSDQAVEAALTIAALAAREAARMPALPAPSLGQPPAPAFASYLDRAKLFQEDPETYRLMQSQ